MALSYVPGVCGPVVRPLSDASTSGPSAPAGTSYLTLTQTSYLAVASPGGATIFTHLRPVVLTVPPGS